MPSQQLTHKTAFLFGVFAVYNVPPQIAQCKRSKYHRLTSERILMSGQKSFSWATQ